MLNNGLRSESIWTRGGRVGSYIFFFFNDTATTEIYTLSLHDALPISRVRHAPREARIADEGVRSVASQAGRSEEHTSELQSHSDLVCRLLLEKKKKTNARKGARHRHQPQTSRNRRHPLQPNERPLVPK